MANKNLQERIKKTQDENWELLTLGVINSIRYDMGRHKKVVGI